MKSDKTGFWITKKTSIVVMDYDLSQWFFTKRSLLEYESH